MATSLETSNLQPAGFFKPHTSPALAIWRDARGPSYTLEECNRAPQRFPCYLGGLTLQEPLELEF